LGPGGVFGERSIVRPRGGGWFVGKAGGGGGLGYPIFSHLSWLAGADTVKESQGRFGSHPPYENIL